MEHFFLCPDCRSEHRDPHEAVVGHLVRCAGCVMLLDVFIEEQAFYAELTEIRIAA